MGLDSLTVHESKGRQERSRAVLLALVAHIWAAWPIQHEIVRQENGTTVTAITKGATSVRENRAETDG